MGSVMMDRGMGMADGGMMMRAPAGSGGSSVGQHAGGHEHDDGPSLHHEAVDACKGGMKNHLHHATTRWPGA